jgi:hypothetical protein
MHFYCTIFSSLSTQSLEALHFFALLFLVAAIIFNSNDLKWVAFVFYLCPGCVGIVTIYILILFIFFMLFIVDVMNAGQ